MAVLDLQVFQILIHYRLREKRWQVSVVDARGAEWLHLEGR